MNVRSAFIAALIVAFPANSIAATQPFAVTNFSRGPLLGEIASTAQLQKDFNANGALIAQAGAQLGLSPSDMATVRHSINSGTAQYVTMPHHLDGMSGARHGVAYSHHNVVIPAGVHGWEVDIEKPVGTLRVFVPNRCGNVSYVLQRRRILAAVPPAFVPAPVPSYQPQATPSPAPVLAVAPIPVPAVAHRSFGFLPWLALGLIGIVLSTHGGDGGSTIPPVNPNGPTPTPIHTVCPPPAAPQ